MKMFSGSDELDIHDVEDTVSLALPQDEFNIQIADRMAEGGDAESIAVGVYDAKPQTSPKKKPDSTRPGSELDRILSLPERPPVDCERRPDPVTGKLVYAPETQALIEIETEKYALPKGTPCDCAESGLPCINELNAEQAWTLREMAKTGGGLGFIPIGSGKTILGILAPLAVPGVKRAVLLAKSDQRLHYRKAWERIRKHFRIPNFVMDDGGDLMHAPNVRDAPTLHFVPYSKLSRPESTRLLMDLNPDIIIEDEVHCVADVRSARTLRWLRFLASRQGLHSAGWSGTLLDKTMRSVAHISAHALGDGSPFPINPSDVEAFASVIDPSPQPDRVSSMAEEIFEAFANVKIGSVQQPEMMNLLIEKVRDGFQRRLVRTPGVITSKGTSSTASITIHERPIVMPEVVKNALLSVRGWVRPDGEELAEAIEQARCARECAAGFHYRWIFPRGEPRELRDEWFGKRKNFNRELREEILKGLEYLDSRLLCERAAIRAWMGTVTCEHCHGTGVCEGNHGDQPEILEVDDRDEEEINHDKDAERCDGTCGVCGGMGDNRYRGQLPIWKAMFWPPWRDIRDKVQHEQEALWMDEYLAKDAAKWALENKGIVWCLTTALGRKIAEISGLPYHGGGPGAEERILSEKGDRSIVASIKAHGEGRDLLQYRFSTQLIAEMPAGGKVWNQLLGRLARRGQAADEIETFVYIHFQEARDALRKAIRQAEFAKGMTSMEQLLLAADFTFPI